MKAVPRTIWFQGQMTFQAVRSGQILLRMTRFLMKSMLLSSSRLLRKSINQSNRANQLVSPKVLCSVTMHFKSLNKNVLRKLRVAMPITCTKSCHRLSSRLYKKRINVKMILSQDWRNGNLQKNLMKRKLKSWTSGSVRNARTLPTVRAKSITITVTLRCWLVA